ncbi:MAG TPA: ABC transporter permease, partial [Candidatus Limnocylindrales bacterium]
MTEPLATGRPLGADEPEPAEDERRSPEPAVRTRRRLGAVRGNVAGIVAIGAKDLRGRMRGRRAFLILTGYLVLLAAFALSTQAAIADTYQTGFGGSAAFASAAIGQGVFGAMLMLMTFLVVVLAPLATASSISLEREKQTLDLLMATPIPSLAIVVGKLLSALAWVFLLIAASIPLMAIVFVYGGVGPDGLIAGYLVLVATALGLGALGLFCSSLVKRTTVATALTIVGVLLVTFRTVTLLLSGPGVGGVVDASGRTAGLLGVPVPDAIVRLDPFVAQTDVMCQQES